MTLSDTDASSNCALETTTITTTTTTATNGSPPSPTNGPPTTSSTLIRLLPGSSGSLKNPDEPPIPTDELSLLAKLEAANKLFENDAKSLNSLHSRKSSDTSEISMTFNGSGGEEDVWSTWAGIVNDWDASIKRKNPLVRDLVRKGIPHHFRTIVWQRLCGAADADKKQYADYIKATSACEKVIRRDIARTYPEHDFFKEKDGLGQEALFNVMKAYSLHDREVGYCQGSGFIVGLLLMQVER